LPLVKLAVLDLVIAASDGDQLHTLSRVAVAAKNAAAAAVEFQYVRCAGDDFTLIAVGHVENKKLLLNDG
jgi:hypothetical protein